MTDRILDPSTPGPAGLYFDLRLLTRERHLAAIPAERAAREALERWCVGCGCRASFGFGCTLASEGTWACADADCQALAEAQAAERGRVEIAPVETRPAAAEPAGAPILDLFGAAA